MVEISMQELLEAGVHFGHQTRRWNPKMKPYIFGKRNGIYIIDLAKTLKRIAAGGPNAFYRGPLARAIVNAQQRTRSELGAAGKGRMTLADLDQYRVAIRQPLVGHYRGWTLAGGGGAGGAGGGGRAGGGALPAASPCCRCWACWSAFRSATPRRDTASAARTPCTR